MQVCTFHDHDIVSDVKHKRKVTLLVKEILKKKKENYNINYIFCSDEYLLNINQEYLQHKTLTDIITFDLTEKGSNTLLSDIYISIDRVRENAEKFKVTYAQELLRVIVHGILHLIGYKDKTKLQKTTMRRMETRWINYFNQHILPL